MDDHHQDDHQHLYSLSEEGLVDETINVSSILQSPHLANRGQYRSNYLQCPN